MFVLLSTLRRQSKHIIPSLVNDTQHVPQYLVKLWPLVFNTLAIPDTSDSATVVSDIDTGMMQTDLYEESVTLVSVTLREGGLH